MKDMRKLGIGNIEEITWGTHFCYFYFSKKEYFESIIPYLTTGLVENELCLWITSKNITEEEAKKQMMNCMSDLSIKAKEGQMEVLPYDEWYLEDGEFDAQRVLKAWDDKLDYAISEGYTGLRIAANTDWLEEKHWDQWIEYERTINETIESKEIIAVCNYSLVECSSDRITDAILSHQFTVINKEGRNRVVANGNNSSIVNKLKKRINFLEGEKELFIDRELKMIELKEEIKRLKGL